MELLTEQQITWIQKEIKRKGIDNPDLEDDLLDHVCCILEEYLCKGVSFDIAFDLVIEKFGAAGFRKIQKETTFLLNLNTTAYRCILALDALMTFILLVVSCSFIFAPLIVYFYQPTVFNICISIPFSIIGFIVLLSGFDFKNFDTVRTNSNIRTLRISLST